MRMIGVTALGVRGGGRLFQGSLNIELKSGKRTIKSNQISCDTFIKNLSVENKMGTRKFSMDKRFK
jgi:hypothetical protein